MRLIEAAAGGVVALVVAVIVVARLDLDVDRLVVAAVAFLLVFVAVLARPEHRSAGHRW